MISISGVLQQILGDSAIGWGYTSKDVSASGTVTLSASEASYKIITLTGTITSDTSVVLPTKSGAYWIIRNNTGGSYTITVKTSGGAGVAITIGETAVVYCDGTDIVASHSDFGIVNQGRQPVTMTDANYNLTYSEAKARSLSFTGTLTAGRNVVIPAATYGEWVIYNNTTGGFSITVKTSGGTGIAVAAGKRAILECDGTNVVRVTADV